jgi:hypothetical protein
MTADLNQPMSFSRREEQRGDRQLDVLTDETNGIRLIVSRLGAELISVARRNSSGDWIGFLNRDDEIAPPEKGWANHATVMGYYLHRIKNERSTATALQCPDLVSGREMFPRSGNCS